MNENIDLTKILKDCPAGWKFYSSAFGEVEFQHIEIGSVHPIIINLKTGLTEKITSNGKLLDLPDVECTLFPSRDQRDWSKFTAPWYKKERFDPKTLKPFDKVLVKRSGKEDSWTCNIFSSYSEGTGYDFECLDDVYENCIPYNDNTKHLVGTTEEAPEYYRYWEE